MSQFPLQCEICQKYFSGPVSAQQHFVSMNHKRKADAKRLQAIQGSNPLFCTSCNKQCNSSRQFEEHCASPQHLAVVERAQRFASPAPSPTPQASGAPFRTGGGAVPRPFAHFRYYCETCNRPMNTWDSYEAHMMGQGHKQQVARQAAPERDLDLSEKEEKEEDAKTAVGKGLIHMTPRSYQVELFCKAMASNCIIFLPTGTGKTVIAAMVVSHMLSLNPRRPVLFLVDKVLLVLQQGQVIARELKDKEFLRSDLSSETKVVHRKPRIAQLCGGLRGVDGIPLFQHDVIVTTAGYCENMLAEGIIRWEDFSLVVLDEAHHCVGRHPYCNIMRTQHLLLPKEKRPKVLGLTASPAGKNTLEDTITMLKNLMESLGRARLGIVEGEQEREELDQYQSKTKITILKAELSHEEKQFCQRLKEYIVRCYLKLAEVSDIKNNASIFNEKSLKKSPEEAVQLCAKEIDDEALNSFIVGLSSCTPKQKPKERAMFDYLLDHAQFTIIILQSIEAGAGLPFAVEEFSKLSSSGRNKFDVAEQYGLPARELMNFVEKLERVAALEKEMEAKGLTQVTLFGQLRHVLFSKRFVDWSQSERPMVLVLVRERLVAIRLSEALQRLDELQKLGLRIHHVVGHGLKAEDGMRVQQQKRVLVGMRGRKYHIVVATSVVEEGVDVPECELVVTLNPPDSVTALVQMRGRARKQGSNFVVICEGEEKKQKLEVLLKREKNMAEAAKRCLQYSQGGGQEPRAAAAPGDHARGELLPGHGAHAPRQHQRRHLPPHGREPLGHADGGLPDAEEAHPGPRRPQDGEDAARHQPQPGLPGAAGQVQRGAQARRPLRPDPHVLTDVTGRPRRRRHAPSPPPSPSPGGSHRDVISRSLRLYPSGESFEMTSTLGSREPGFARAKYPRHVH